MISFKSLPVVLALGLGLGLSAFAYGQDSGSNAANGQSAEQLAQLFGRLDTNADGVLSLDEFQQMRGAGRGMMPPRGERMGQMTPEQREQMRERMQDLTPEQREQMREQMRDRRQQGQDGAAHEHGEP
jgi:hypothetical protein